MLFFIALLPGILAQLDDLTAICNPLVKTCPQDAALGGVLTTDFVQGESNYWTVYSGPQITFGPDGGTFTATPSNSNLIMASISYVMFGRVEIAMKRSLAQGIVASLNFQSDAGDNISFDWHGIEKVVRLNWSGLGYNVPGREFNVTDGTMDFNTYTIDWTSERIQWLINGAVAQTVTRADVPSNSKFPQTPASVKMGIWNSGDYADPSISAWAGGPVNWNGGPYNMSVKSINLTDYSSGTAYRYSDQSGKLESIVSVGGSVNGSSNSTSSPVTTSTSPLGSISTSSTASSSTTTAADVSQGLTTAAKAGLGIGVVVAVLALLLAIFLIWRRKRNIQARKADHYQKGAGLIMQQGPGIAID